MKVELTAKKPFLERIRYYKKQILITTPIIAMLVFAVYSQTAFKEQKDTRSRAEIVKINVSNYGAKGDGVANDSPAIQAAINAAQSGQWVVLDTGKTYRVDATLQLRNGVTLYGPGATLYTPYHTSDFKVLNAYGTTGAVVRGDLNNDINILSDWYSNYDVATGQHASYITGIAVKGSTDFTVQYYTSKWLDYGWNAAGGSTTTNLKVDHWTGIDDAMGCYMSMVNGGSFTNIDTRVRSDGPSDRNLEHNFYISKGNHNLIFDNIKMSGGVWGYSMSVYNSLATDTNPNFDANWSQDLTFNNITVDSPSGIFFQGVDRVKVTNLTIYTQGVKNGVVRFRTASNLTFDGFTLSTIDTRKNSIYAFDADVRPITNLTIQNGIYNEIKTPLVYNSGNVTGLTTSNVTWMSIIPTPTITIPTMPPQITVAPTLTPTAVPTMVPTRVPTTIPTVIPTAIPTKVPTVIPTNPPQQQTYGITVMATDTRRNSYRMLNCSISGTAGYTGITPYTKNSSAPISVTLTAPSKCSGRSFSYWSTGLTNRTITAGDSTANNGEQVYTAYYR